MKISAKSTELSAMTSVWPEQKRFTIVAISCLAVLFALSSTCSCVTLMCTAITGLYLADLLLKTFDEFAAERILMKDTSKRAVLITGCDSGFGNKLAKKLSKLGFTVYAGCLSTSSAGAVEIAECPGVTTLPLDVTKQEDVDQAFDTVKQRLTKHGLELWAIVNNAGISERGEVEMLSMTDYQRVAEVNVFGTVRVTKAFLPLLRTAHTGRVVNVASQAGRFTPYGFTSYSMSKHATVSFSDGLRLEMKKWNISVHTIEPGLYKTNITDPAHTEPSFARQWSAASESVKSAYGHEYHQDHLNKTIKDKQSGRPACKVYEVVDDLLHAVAAVNPKVCYVPSTYYKMFTRVLRELPFEFIDSVWITGQPNVAPAALQ